LVGLNAAAKLDDHPERSSMTIRREATKSIRAYAQRLWNKHVALAILRANREPFLRSACSFTPRAQGCA
jgi:hypothetical protein